MNAYDAINRVAHNHGWTGTANGMMVTYTRGNANESISVHYTRAYGVYAATTGSANGSCELGYKTAGKLQTIKNWFIEAEFMLKLTNLADGIVPNARVAVRGEGNGVVTEVNGNVSVALDDGTTVHVEASDVSVLDAEPAIVTIAPGATRERVSESEYHFNVSGAMSGYSVYGPGSAHYSRETVVGKAWEDTAWVWVDTSGDIAGTYSTLELAQAAILENCHAEPESELCGAEYAPGAAFRCTLPTGHDNPLNHEDHNTDAPNTVAWTTALPWELQNTDALTNTDANGGNGTGDVLAERTDSYGWTCTKCAHDNYTTDTESAVQFGECINCGNVTTLSPEPEPSYICGWTNGNTESPCGESAPNDASYCPEHERVSAELRARIVAKVWGQGLGNRPYDLNKATDACESSIVRDAHDAATARGLTGAERRTYVANYANNCQDNADEQYRAEIERVRNATGYRSITPNDWRTDVADRVGLTHRAHVNNWEYVGVQTDYGKVFARANYRVAVTFVPGGRVAGAVRVNMDKLRSDSVEHTDNYSDIARWLDETPKHHGTGAQFDAESGRVRTVTYTYERIASNTDNPTYTRETTFGYLTHNGARGVFRALLRSARAESATTLPTHVTIDETPSGKPIRGVVTGVTEGIRWRVTIENDRHYGTFVWDESSIGERRIVVPRKVERNRP